MVGTGCKKLKRTENSTTVTVTPGGGGNPQPTGGLGGNASLKITPEHDGVNIDSSIVYIKYNASVIPVNGQFDDSAWSVRGEGNETRPIATFSGLKPGSYYVYSKGWDLIRSVHVHGGMRYIVPEDNQNTTHYYTLPMQPED